MKLRLILGLLTLAQTLNAQLVDESMNDVDFVAKKIREVYAGFYDKTNDQEFSQLTKEAKRIAKIDKFMGLSYLTGYFNDYHLTVFRNHNTVEVDSVECDNVYKKVVSSKRSAKKLEGFWVNEKKDMVIYLVESTRKLVNGYLIQSSFPAQKGALVLSMPLRHQPNKKAFFRNFEQRFDQYLPYKVLSDSLFLVGSANKWRRLNDYPLEKGITLEPFDKTIRIEQIDSGTCIFRMHDFFSTNNARKYDSVIKVNDNVLKNSKTLMIDLRNNLGGNYRGGESVMPFLCTQPMLMATLSRRVSHDLIEDVRNIAREATAIGDLKKAKSYEYWARSLAKDSGKMRESYPDTLECKTVPNNIKHVAVLINHASRSAAEIVLLLFKQSSKVTVFGEHSAGALDYLDLQVYQFANKEFKLWVGTTKRQTTELAPSYDKTGIPPQIDLSHLPEDQWIDYIRKYYANK